MIRILAADPLNAQALEQLSEIPEFEVVEKLGLSPDELACELPQYEAVIVRSATQLSREVLAPAKKLRLIVRVGIGLDNIAMDYARARGIEVRNTPAATAVTVAEFTLAALLGACRFIGPAYQSMKAHRWEKRSFAAGIELDGKTAGIVGMGRIGRAVARRLIALGMRVLFSDRQKIRTDLDCRQVSLEELLREADVISIHLPLNESTRGLIGERELAMVKEKVVLVIPSRGGIVNEAALLHTLAAGKIRAVAVDAYESEPPQQFALIDQERVFPSPHLAGSTAEGQERAGLDAIAILKEFFNV